MQQLIAIFDIELPFNLLFNRDKNDELVYETRIDGFDVRLSFKGDGAETKRDGNEHWSFSVSTMQIRVSGEENIEPPQIGITEEGHKDLRVRAPYFDERTHKYQEIAVKVANRVIRFFKYRLHNPLLYELTSDKYEFQNPTWTDELGQEIESGIMHIVSEGVLGLGSSEFGIKEFARAHDSDLQETLQRKIETQVYEELLSDAQTAIFQNNLRRGILEMAIACEVAIKQAFFGKATAAGSAFEYLEDKRSFNIGIIDLIDGAAKRAFGESFRDFDKTAYTGIDHLFRCRNKVAHGREITYQDDKGLFQVTTDTVKDWWRSVEKLFNWLNKHQH